MEMDEMKIESRFLTGIISKVLSKILKKKLGLDADICIRRVNFKRTENGTLWVKLEAEGFVDEKSVESIVEEFL